jgi:hypothetical protein
MRIPSLAAWPATAVLALLLTPGSNHAQQPPGFPRSAPRPPDEFRSLVEEIEEAYEAPFEVDEEILNQLRRQYRRPSTERDQRILREVRRAYNVTPAQEQEILQALRQAYEQPSPAQEAKVFQVIRRNGRLPLGTVPESVQIESATRMFRRCDRFRDDRLVPEEMPEPLRVTWRQWDRSGDGALDLAEYTAHYQAALRSVAARVATGEIPIDLPDELTPPRPRRDEDRSSDPPPATRRSEDADKSDEPPPVAVRYGRLPPGLPDWFVEFDTDRDGQVGLYEWRAQGRSWDEFGPMDLNRDFLITPREMVRFLGKETDERPDGPASATGNRASDRGDRR